MRTPLLILGMLAALLGPTRALGGCGLENIATPMPGSTEDASGLYIPIRTRVARYQLGQASGRRYWTDLGVQFWGKDRIILSGAVPLVLVDPDAGALDAGLGNPTANVQLWSQPAEWIAVSGGVQMELPLGKAGLVDAHWTVLNHVRATAGRGLTWVQLRAGFLKTFGGAERTVAGHPSEGDIGSASPSPADPHADQELRVQSRLGLSLGSWTPAAVLDAAIELENDSPGHRFYSAGASLDQQLSERVRATLSTLVPLGASRRFAWQAGLGLTLRR